MRAFASAWTERAITQAPLAQLTWYTHLAFERLDDKAVRPLVHDVDHRARPDSDFAAHVFKPPPIVT